uniref:Uncharacterized protein n=1 Tax=Neolamprologus brichardi TaxID=32507 RepID=A0A3Q4M587_NEOBR
MALSGDEPICPKFQPNIFDPSRCHDCLRQRHLAVLGKVIITDQNKCRYVYTAKIFSLAYLHALHMPHVFCDSP